MVVDSEGNATVVWLDNGEAWEADTTIRLRTTTIVSTTVPAITKHYYANGQRIASWVDDRLYYVLNAPNSPVTAFVDDTGQEVGHIILDSSGEVVENTLPVTLTEKLVSHLNPTANLQYNGQRWYDATANLYTQPGTVGGVPSAPQPFNGYGGVNAANFLGNLFLETASSTLGYYGDLTQYFSIRHFKGWTRIRSAQPFWQFSTREGDLRIEAAPATLKRLGWSHLFEPDLHAPRPGGNRTGFITRELVEQIGGSLYRAEGGEIIDLGVVSSRRWLQFSSFNEIQTQRAYYRRVVAPVVDDLPGLVKFGLKNGLPFGIDAGVQLWLDWDTDMPVGHRLGRAGIAGGVGLGVGVVIEIGLGAALGTTPPGWLVIGVGVIAGLTFEQEIVNGIYDLVGLEE